MLLSQTFDMSYSCLNLQMTMLKIVLNYCFDFML